MDFGTTTPVYLQLRHVTLSPYNFLCDLSSGWEKASCCGGGLELFTE
jgi:hypothetical protein